MTRRTRSAAFLLVSIAALTASARGEPSGDVSVERAEALVAEGSYAQAREVFVELARGRLGAEDARWVEFRLADTSWRSAAATAATDTTDLDRAREALEGLAATASREPDRDRVWAEVQESLGDFWWSRPATRNWGAAWPRYQQALDWWARATDIDLARERYLAIVWKAAEPPHAEPYAYYGYFGNQLPETVLRNVLRITAEPGARAHAWFLIAMGLRSQSGTPGQMRRLSNAFDSALAGGPKSGWYDDALYNHAEWLMQVPDFPRALELYRRLTREFDKGETRYWDDATRRIVEISAPQLGVVVPEMYLPGSNVRYQLSWRNVTAIDLVLYPVDLARDVRWRDDTGSGDWLERIELSGREPARSWSWQTNDDGHYMPGREAFTLEGVGAGAYVLEARTAERSARDLVLVTSASVVLKTAKSRALAWVTDAITGAPRGGAEVVFWMRSHDGSWSWSSAKLRADADGLASVDLPASDRQIELFVAAGDDEQQAFATSARWTNRGRSDDWRLYVFTDRPAYRPGERAQWKVIARRFDGSVHSTPAGHEIRYRIVDPRGAKLDEGTLALNGFGSGWGRTDLGEELPLGEYRVDFEDTEGGRSIGGATLLRLEEYKLPEYRVDVRTAEEDGRPRALQVGDPVEAEIVAEYYFGGPVADAKVEVLVYQRPLWIRRHEPREFPWFYEDMDPSPRFGWYGPGQIVHREQLATGADGRARVRFEPPYDPSQDFEYTIEARVTDASRREILGRGTVRASRQRYFAFLNAAHNLYGPGDEVRIAIRTTDANEQPYAAEGRVRVTRDRWVEIWIDPAGREVSGEALGRVRRSGTVFPPPPSYPGDPGWRLKFNGYEHEEVLSRRLTTGAAGEAELSFVPRDDGFYRVAWSGDDDEPFPVTAETTVWVADRDTVEIGYRPGGVQVLVDADTFRVGRSTPVMLSAAAADSWVLWSVESEDLHDVRVVHLTGNVKLLELDVAERHVPNVFLEAAMVRDGELFADSRQVVVPPLDHFLEVEVAADREEYRPRETGALTVTTRDHEGRPVPAEVALALVDESVFYIQQDYAADPRQFFYGGKRGRAVQTTSSFQGKRYRKLERVDEDKERTEYAASELSSVGYVGGRREAKSMAGRTVAMDEVAAASPAPSTVAPGAEPAVQVRSDFRATALWVPDVVTDENGTARVEVSFPDSLTTWKATARAATSGNRFGQATASTRTKKPLIVRLQAPRFFVVGDRAVVSAVVNNNTDEPLALEVTLEAAGLELLDVPAAGVEVAAQSERRLDWRLAVREAGQARLTVSARGGGNDDAMVLDYPVFEHGIEKFVSRSGKVRGDEVRVALDLPSAHRAGSASLVVQVTPSLAVTMLDALPYLADYPYGCTEQTMSRFLPAVITTRTLEDLGLRPEQVARRAFGGVEAEHAAATHPAGAADLARLDEMVRAGLRRLYDFQHRDGGWGWWKEGESDPFMTSYVVWGLGLARDAGTRIEGNALRRGIEFLEREIVGAEERPDLQAFMLHALSASATGHHSAPGQAAFASLWARRDRLNAYSRSLLALSADYAGDGERARILVRNLANGVKRDRAPDGSVLVAGRGGSPGVVGTAHWGADGIWWRWADGPVEATSFALRALVAIDPGNELVEPVANWLIRNRRGAQWSNTRDTAIAVLALGDYLRASGELGSTVAFEVRVNGRKAGERRVESGDVLKAPSRFEIDPAWLRDGQNEIRVLRTSGDGPLYFAADLRYFSLEEPITAAGNEIFARRAYEKLTGRPTLLAGYLYDREPLADGGRISSGERVEVGIVVEAKNDYEYLVFEDLKPAGLEAVQLRSGEPLYARELSQKGIERLDGARDPGDFTGRTRPVYQELRDRKIALFLDKLPQGIWEIRYELRAETPGSFHALPLMGHAMYVPEIRCNGAETRLEVEEAARGVTGP